MREGRKDGATVRGQPGRTGWTVIIAVALVALIGGTSFWAMKSHAVAMLDWLDARFTRDDPVTLVSTAHYGRDPHQIVELYRPAHARADAPLVIFIHGGGWNGGRPQDYRFVARTLGNLGYPVALIGYRLVPQGRFPVMLKDSAAGVRLAIARARAAGLPSSRIVLTGHSAGGYNAMMLGLDRRWLTHEGVTDSAVAGVIGLAGPYDFYPFDTEVTVAAFGQAPDPAPTQPINFARAAAPPLLLITGGDDQRVAPRNARSLTAAVRAKGGRVEWLNLPGLTHAGLVMALARPFDRDPRVTAAMARFLGSIHVPAESTASAPVQGTAG